MKNNAELKSALRALAMMINDDGPRQYKSAEDWRIIADALDDAASYARKCASFAARIEEGRS